MVRSAYTHAGRFPAAQLRDILPFEDHVPVHDEKRTCDKITGCPNCISRSTLMSLRGIFDVDPPFGTIAEMPADLPFAISDNKNKLGDTSITDCKDKVLHHRAIGKREHHFRAFRGQGAHPFSFPCCENDTFHRYSSSYKL